MITNKILPSFYRVTVEGRATECIVPSSFNVETVTINSRKFSSDLEAATAAEKLVSRIVGAIQASDVKTEVELNPEFFPTAAPLKVPEEVVEETTAELVTGHASTQQGSITLPVIITRDFDELGDFVEMRTTVRSDDFNIVSKVLVDPSHYLHEKGLAMLQRYQEPALDHRDSQAAVRIH